jgi:RNA polymerase sigma factor (sigma-70 family)
MTEEHFELATKIIYKMIHRKFRWILEGNPDLRHDLYQEAMLSVLEAYPNYNSDKAQFSTYIYPIVFRSMLKFSCDWKGREGKSNKLRYKPRRDDLSIQALTDNMFHDDIDESKNIFLYTEDTEFASCELMDVIENTLQPIECYIFLKVTLEGVKQRELAKELKMTPPAINYHYKQSKIKLKKALS